MRRESSGTLWRQLSRHAGCSDRDLLDRFASHNDEPAFEELLQRHGPLVLRVCRAVLHDAHLAEDAFQATFLILSRKARSIRQDTNAASWLYKVAYRVALRARAASVQRQQREAQVPFRPSPDSLTEVSWREVQQVLEEELQRLPEKYQMPIVLCCLQGHARDEAAQLLGWSSGQLKARLERGREVLRTRLARRGIALSAVLGATLVAADTLRAAVPRELTSATVRAGCAWKAGNLSPRVLTLVRAGSRSLLLMRLNVVIPVLLLATLFAAGAGLLSRSPGPNPTAPPDAPRRISGQPAVLADALGDPLPADAVTRLGTTRWRHMHTITSVAYSRDGSRLLSGSWDGTVRLWDAADGRELLHLVSPNAGFSSVALSPDASLLAGGDMHRTLYVWDGKSGKEVYRLENLSNTVFGLRFSADGKLLAGVSGATARVWEAATGKEVHRLVGPTDDLRPFAFSPDLKTLVSATKDGCMHVWDLPTGGEVRQIATGQTELSPLAFSPDGKLLASSNTKDRLVRLWDVSAGKELRRFGPCGNWVGSFAFAPDGKLLAAGDADGGVSLFDPATGAERCKCKFRQNSWVLTLAFSPDGKTLAVGGNDEHALRFYDTGTGAECCNFAGHRNEIVSAGATSGGKLLLSLDRDGTVCFWDLRTGKEQRRQMRNVNGCGSLAISPDGRRFALAEDCVVHLGDTNGTREEGRQLQGHQGPVQSVAFSPDGGVLASGSWVDHTIRFWDVATGIQLHCIALPMPNGKNYGDLPLVFSLDGKVLVSGSGDRANPSLYFWDAATGRQAGRCAFQACRLALSPDGGTLASAGIDEIRLWDMATHRERARFPAKVVALAFAPDGRTIAYGGIDGTVHLWEIAAAQERRTFHGHESGGRSWGDFAAGVATLAYTPDGRQLISGSGDTTLLVWDLYASPARAARSMPELWSDLGGDAPGAHAAVVAFLASGGETVAFLKERLRPAAAVDADRLQRLIKELDSDQFEARQRATRELEQLNETAVPALRRALSTSPSPEARRRLEEILGQLEEPSSAAQLRSHRAIEVLERLGTPEAKLLLQALAHGVPGARLTEDAEAALERLRR